MSSMMAGAMTPIEVVEFTTSTVAADEIAMMGSDVNEPTFSRRLLYGDIVELKPESRGQIEWAHFDSYMGNVMDLASLARTASIAALAERGMRLKPEIVARHVGLVVCQSEATVGRHLITEWLEYQTDSARPTDYEVVSTISDITAQRFNWLFDRSIPRSTHPARSGAYWPAMRNSVYRTMHSVLADYDQMIGDNSAEAA